MAYVVEETKLKAKNTVVMSLQQEIAQIDYQVNVLEQSLFNMVNSYFESGISSSGDRVISELQQVRERLILITRDLELAISFAEKLDVMTWAEEDENGESNFRYY